MYIVCNTLATIEFDHRSESMRDTKYDIAIGYRIYTKKSTTKMFFFTSLKCGQNHVHCIDR